MKNKKVKIIFGVLAGILILGTAAFVRGRLLNNRSASLGGVVQFGDNATSMTTVEIEPTASITTVETEPTASITTVETEPTPLLPKTDALVFGTLSERKDNIILVQTVPVDASSGGNIAVAPVASVDDAGEIVTDFAGDDGPKVEVVVTKDTLIYKDVTEFHYKNNENEPTQQKLEPCSLDYLSKSSMITVWGRKVGDRTIANVIMIYNPTYINVP